MLIRIAATCALAVVGIPPAVGADTDPPPSLERLTFDAAFARASVRSLRRAAFDSVRAMRVDASDRAVVAGIVGASVQLTRLDARGRLDSTFGTDGSVRIPTTWDEAHDADLEIDEAGRIVVVAVGLAESTARSVVARFLADGSADPSFAADGVAEPSAAGRFQLAARIRASAVDGTMLVLADRPGTDAADSGLGIVRIDANGELDASYGSGGFAPIRRSAGTDSCVVADFAIDIAGRAVVAVRESAGFAFESSVRRLDAAGVPDPSFVGFSDPAAVISRVAFDGGQRIVALDGRRVVRRLADGSPDPSFADAGARWRATIEAPRLADPTAASVLVVAGVTPRSSRTGGVVVQALDPEDPGAIVRVTCPSPARGHCDLRAIVAAPGGALAFALAATRPATPSAASGDAAEIPFVARVDLAARAPLELPSLRATWLGPLRVTESGRDVRISGRVRIRNMSPRRAESIGSFARFGYGDGAFSSELDGEAEGTYWRPFRLRARASVVRRFEWSGAWDGPAGAAGATVEIRFSSDLPDGDPGDDTATSPPMVPRVAASSSGAP